MKLTAQKPDRELKPHEHKLLELITQGLTVRQVSALLFMNYRVVAEARRRILKQAATSTVSAARNK